MLEVQGNLFSYPHIGQSNVGIAHCISADYALGKGFAAEIESRYHIRDFLKTVYKGDCPDVIIVDNIVNLVTKERYWQKPTYENFDKTLIMAREKCLEKGIDTLIMPRIGCGLDRLDWRICKDSIKFLIDEYDIDCIVFYIK